MILIMPTELITQAIKAEVFDAREGSLLTWLGSAGVLLNARGTVLLIDPVLALAEIDGETRSETGHRLKLELPIEAARVPRADAVLYTHADGDHLGRRTAEILNERLRPRFIAPPPVVARLEDLGVEANRIVVAEDFMTLRIGEAEIHITPALHDWQPESPWRRGDCCGFLVRTPDGAVWHPGDTRLIDELLQVKDVDVLWFDIAQALAHLGPEGSARLAESCGARDLIAYHYGTFDVPPGGPFGCDPEDCRPVVAGLPATFHILNPGEAFRLVN